MATIKSGVSTDELSVDAVSKAARVTLYNPDGTLTTVLTPGGATAANQVLEIAQLTTIANNTANIDVDTSDIEVLITSTNTKLDTGNTSLAAIKLDLDAIALDTANIDVNLSTIASEATLIQVRDYLDTVETKLTSIITNTTGLGLEVTQIQVRDYLDTVETSLASIITNTTGKATEATLALIKAKTDNLDVALSTIAQQATLALIKAKTDNLDVLLSTLLKPADTLAGITLVSTLTDITNVVKVNDNGGSLTIDNTNLDSPLSGLLKPADTLTKVTTVDTITNPVAVTGSFFQGTQPVSAVDLDIRNLSQTQDSVLIYGSDDGGTTKRVIKTDAGGAIQVDLEVSSVTVNNAGGASAVNIQDGGNSITVDGAFFQATQPVSAASLPLPTGAATSALQTQPGVDIGDVTINNASGASAVNIQDGGNSITIDGTITANAGTNLNTSLLALETTQTTQNTQIGIVTETAPATDTASSGLNGRLQRIAQRITSLIAQIPAALGQGTMAQSMSVTLASDQSAIPIIITDAIKTTYSASGSVAVAASATDIFTITGSATKTIKIISIELCGIQTTASVVTVMLIKRSTANTGGTSSTLTNVSHDSTDAAGTATVRTYTANPTTGTLVGNPRVWRAFVSTITGSPSRVGYEDILSGKSITLRGTGQVLSLNLNGVTVAGSNFGCFVSWTEE